MGAYKDRYAGTQVLLLALSYTASAAHYDVCAKTAYPPLIPSMLGGMQGTAQSAVHASCKLLAGTQRSAAVLCVRSSGAHAQ